MNGINCRGCNACQAEAGDYFTSLTEERTSVLSLPGGCKAGVMKGGH